MERIIEFEGRRISVPPDASDDEIAAILGGSSGGTGPTMETPAPKTDQSMIGAGGALQAAQQAQQTGVSSPETPFLSQGKGRSFMLGAQSVGSGLADLAATPVDLSNLAANVLLSGADKVSQKLGGPEISYRYGSAADQLKNATGNVFESMGVPMASPETLGEKTLYHATRFATQNLALAPGLAAVGAARAPALASPNAMPKWYDPLTRPYADAPVKTATGDVLAGAGAGSLLTASQELLPENVRQMGGGAVGALTDFAAMGVGGLGGGVAAEVATGTPTYVARQVRNAMPDQRIPLNPETGAAYPRTAVDAAAEFVQREANAVPGGYDLTRAPAAADTLRRNAQGFIDEGLPVPTSGSISGNEGLKAVEAAQRAKNQGVFVQNDTKLRDAAVQNVKALGPEGGNPALFPQTAQEIADARVNAAQRGVNKAAGEGKAVAMAQRPLADELAANQGAGVGASRSLDENVRATRNEELRVNRELYNDPALVSAVVSPKPMTEALDAVASGATQRAPLDPVVAKYVDRFGTKLDPEGNPIVDSTPFTMAQVNKSIAEVEADISNNLANAGVVRELRGVKNVLQGYADALAQQGGAAGMAAKAATENYETRIAPHFRKGAGGDFDAALKRDKTGAATRPSETAEFFLTSPEGAADLARIAALQGRETAVSGAAKTWLMDKLASTGVAANGAIDPSKLARWRNRNLEIIDNVPGFRKEIDGMLATAQRGERLTGEYASALKNAESNLAEVQKSVQRGPLGLVADKSPENAVRSVMSAANPERAMGDLVKEFSARPEAKKSLQKAVANHIEAKVSGVNPAGVSEGEMSVRYAALVKEFNASERVLAKVYSPEEMNTLRRAQKVLAPLAQRSQQATVGSPTAENTELLWKVMRVGLSPFMGNLRAGGTVARLRDSFTLTFGKGDASSANELIKQMMFNPDLAAHLLTRKMDVNAPAWNAKLQKYLRWGEAVRGANENLDEQ